MKRKLTQVVDHSEIRVGQIRSSKRSKPTALYVVIHMYERVYKSGERAVRVLGFPTEKSIWEGEWLPARDIGTPEPQVQADCLNDLDARSVLKMYPYVTFEPFEPEPEETK